MSQLGQLITITTPVTSLTGDTGLALTGALKIKGGNNITTAALGTDITVNVSGTTNHAIQLGNVGGSLSSLAVGATGTVLTGVTGADPAFSASPTVTTIYAGTFDTNLASAGVTLSGTTLSADGTDVDININITAKGAGKVIIDDLQLTTDLAVTEGGTGVSTLLDHGLLVGSGASPIDSIAVGGTGVILQGVTGADPTWSTATYPSTVALGDVLVASAANVVGVVNDVTNAGYVLTANAAAAPTFQVLPTPVVGSFASDAETIAGTVTNKAVAPSNLKAKLGLQTIYALPIGASDSAALGWLAVGATNEILIGNTGANASWSSSPTVTTMNATTFDTNVVAAGTTLSGTTWAADGTNANIGLTITPKGTGGLTLTTGSVGITSGNLTLPQSTSTIGQIQITGISGTTTVMHNHTSGFMLASFGPNIYIGDNTGDKTTNGIYAYGGCIGIGNNVLPNFSIAYDMIGIGSNAFKNAVNARDCIAIGYNAFLNLSGTGGIEGPSNIAIGTNTGAGLINGGYNIILGVGSGSSIGAASESNIYIHNIGANENNTIRIGTSGTGASQQNKAYIAGIYGVTPAGTINIALVDSNGQLGSTATLPASLGGKMAWTTATADVSPASVDTGYLIKHATPATKLTITLPTTAALYSEIEITGTTIGMWKLAQNANQTIHFGSLNTTTGASGYLEATGQYDCIKIRCTVANLDFVVVQSVGTITVV